jgi:ADP-dependent glucokinase
MAVTIDRAIASSFFILFIVALPYFTNTFHSELEVIRDALIYQETRYSVNTSMRAAVGFGSCLDMVTNGVLLLDRAGISPPLSPQHFDVVSSPDELAQVFAYFFENGAAAE